MTTTNLDVRKLNAFLKATVPFFCKASRKPHMEVVIGADAGKDLSVYADAIKAEFGDSIIRMDVYGMSNYITLIAR